MDKRERLEATLKGEKVDRVAVALWRHFPVDDQRPEDLAAATLEFQRLYDFDLVKVTPASSFCLKDWGVEDEWRGSPDRKRVKQAPHQSSDSRAVKTSATAGGLPTLPRFRTHVPP